MNEVMITGSVWAVNSGSIFVRGTVPPPPRGSGAGLTLSPTCKHYICVALSSSIAHIFIGF